MGNQIRWEIITLQ